MADFNSKYTGEQVEALLDIVAEGGSGGGGEGEVQKTTEAEITAMGFTKNIGTITEVKMNGVSKGTSGVVDLGDVQTPIADLATIREGASKGATALQSIPEEYVTEEQLIWTKVEGESGVRLKGTNGTATGNLAISAGDDKTASDGTPFPSVASGDHAVAFGYGNTCSGRTTLAQGLYNIVTSKDAVAFGQRNTVNGDQAFAAGQQNEVSARIGVAIGYKNKATNTDSIAIGYQNTSSGSASVAMGDTCEAIGTSSVAMGYKTKAAGAYTSTFGENTQATNEGEVAMGKYNKSTTSTDTSEQTLFSFGIGTSDTNRANALEIKKNGDVYIGDKMLSDFATTTDLDGKVDKISGKQLSTEDFTSALKTKLEGLSNYNDAAIQAAVTSLQTQLNTLTSGNTSAAIESFNEIIAFLDGVTDSESLDSIIASIEQQIAGKQATISDLSTIRSGASKGATAVQPSSLATVATSGSYNDLSNRPTIPAAVTESTVSGWGFTKNSGTYSKPSGGIPKSDLASAVQTSLGKADTALQSYTEQYKGTVTGVKVNGSTYSPTNGIVDLGTISGGGSSGGGSEYAGNYPILRNNQYGDTINLQPNVFTVLTTQYISKMIDIQLSAATNTNIVNEYIVAVYVGGNVSLYHPIDIVWANNEEPIIESGYTYIMSFVDNIGMWTRVSGNIYNAQVGDSGGGSDD